MFRSKRHNLITPQSEHLRLVGAIALHWGNEHFERPSIPFDSFVTGTALHDWGHGFFDTNEIGAMDRVARIRSMHSLVHTRLSDPAAEAVMQFHVLRLMGDEPIYIDLRPELDSRIEANIARTGIARSAFEWADRITNLADMVSFDFCFGEEAQNTIPVFAKQADQEQTNVTYTIAATGQIKLEPWPLSVDSLTGYVLAYDGEGYPQIRVPTMVRYEIIP